MKLKNLIVESAYRGTLPDKQVDAMITPYYSCPSCGQEFDPKEGFVEFPDVYLECNCGYDLAMDFSNDILELWMANKIDRMEGDR